MFLFAVLAIASVAQGQLIELVIMSKNGLPVPATKEITVVESDWVDFDIVASGLPQLLLDLNSEVYVTGLGSMDWSEPTWHPASSPEFNRIVDVDPPTIYGVDTGAFSGMGDGWLVDHGLVHCDLGEPENDVYVDIRNVMTAGGTMYLDMSPYDGAWSGITIHNVPEPMTIALLGLGGLALLRRRK
jgi:hypothetical protein